jgi:16S rRNA G527 N7-methylase RsmG
MGLENLVIQGIKGICKYIRCIDPGSGNGFGVLTRKKNFLSESMLSKSQRFFSKLLKYKNKRNLIEYYFLFSTGNRIMNLILIKSSRRD